MPYGLKNAPVILSDLINQSSKIVLDQYILVHIDDILVYSRNSQDHTYHLIHVM